MYLGARGKMDQLGKVVAGSNFRAGNLLLSRSGNRGNFVPVTIFPGSRTSRSLLKNSSPL